MSMAKGCSAARHPALQFLCCHSQVVKRLTAHTGGIVAAERSEHAHPMDRAFDSESSLSGQPLLPAPSTSLGGASDSSPLFARAAAASPVKAEPISLQNPPTHGKAGSAGLLPPAAVTADSKGISTTSAPAAGELAADGAAAGGAEVTRGEPAGRKGHSKIGAKRKHGGEARAGRNGASAAPAKAASVSTKPQDGKVGCTAGQPLRFAS